MYTTELENLIDQLQRYRVAADRWHTERRRQHYTLSCWHLVEKLLPSLPTPYADSWRSKMHHSWKRPPPAFPSLTRGYDIDQLLQSPPAPLPTGPPSVCAVLSDHSDAVRAELGRRGFGCFSVRQRQTTAAAPTATVIESDDAEAKATCAAPTPVTLSTIDNNRKCKNDDDDINGTAMTDSTNAVSPAHGATAATTAKKVATTTTTPPPRNTVLAYTDSDGQLTHGVINLDVNGAKSPGVGTYVESAFLVTKHAHTCRQTQTAHPTSLVHRGTHMHTHPL